MGRAPARAPSPSYGGYSSQGGDTIRDLILQRGRIAAQGARDSGSFWSGALGAVGGAASSYFDEREAKKEEERVQQAIRAAQTPRPFVGPTQPGEARPADRAPDLNAIMGSLPPELRARAQKGLAEIDAAGYAVNKRKLELEKAGADAEKVKTETAILNGDRYATMAHNVREWMGGPDAGRGAFAAVVGRAAEQGLPVDEYMTMVEETEAQAQQAQQSGDPAAVEAFNQSYRERLTPMLGKFETLASAGLREKWANLEKAQRPETVEVKMPDGSTQLVEKKPGVTSAAELPKVGTVGSHILKRFGPKPTAEQEARGVKEFNALNDRPQDPIARELALQRLSDAKGKSGSGGRSVTSGDANRLGEINTGLADLERLKGTLVGGVTGAASKVGTMLPDAVTEFTGWGAESKQTQANIDLVKQIIGKGLEGGVLRKEDEVKYAKILPKIGDPQEVVDGKLRGLVEALTRKREDTLSALEDAEYDVSKFRTRIGGGRGVAAPGAGPKVGEKRTVNGKNYEWDGRGWLAR